MPLNSYKGYYGIMKGIVTRTDDPNIAENDNRRRVQVCIPSYHLSINDENQEINMEDVLDPNKTGLADNSSGIYPWAQVCSNAFNGSSGSESDNTKSDGTVTFWGKLLGAITGIGQNNQEVDTTSSNEALYPSVGDRVWLMFEGGDIRCPVYIGSLSAQVTIDNSLMNSNGLYSGNGTSLVELCINMLSTIYGLSYDTISNTESTSSGSSSNLKITSSKIISLFNIMYKEHWSYENAAARKGCVDCSGAFVYAYNQNGLSIYHGSNRIARVYVESLIPYETAVNNGLIVPGMAAFKIHKPGDSGYNLPSEYQSGGKYYNGDLNDYYHIGLIDNDTKYVLNAANSTDGFMRGNIENKWVYVAKLKAIDYGDNITTITNNSNANDSKYSRFGILGWFENSAKELFTSIKGAMTTEFSEILSDNNAEKFMNDLNKSSWSGYKVQYGSTIYKALVSILTSEASRTYQDAKAASDISEMISNANTCGLSSMGAIMLYVFTVSRGYKDFADYAANKGGSNSTLDSFYKNLMDKFTSYPDSVKNAIKKAYEYISSLESRGVLNNIVDASTPTGSTPGIGSTITANGDGVSSATSYNNWYIGLKSTTLGSTRLNPSNAHIWNAHKIYNALKSQGYNLPAIAGILGNMQTESGLSPGAIQNGHKSQLPNNATKLSTLTNNIMLEFYDHSKPKNKGYAVGLIQWDGVTGDASPYGEVLVSYAIRNNKMWYDGDLQMDRLAFEYEHDQSGGNVPVPTTGKTYVWWYPKNYDGITWKQYKTINKSARDCADIFRRCKERSSGEASGNESRRDNAEYWYNYFNNSPSDPTGGSTVQAATTVTSAITNTAVANTVIASTGPNTDAIKPINYKQFDSRWKNKQFGPGSASDRTYGAAACSVTSMADIVHKFADSSVTPVTIGDLAVLWKFRTATSNGLTDPGGFFKKCAEKYGFKMTSSYKGNGDTCYNKLRNALDTGQNATLLILGVKGIYSKGGHFVVAWKTNGDKTCINDPGINSSATNGPKRENVSSSDLKASVNSLYIFKKG